MDASKLTPEQARTIVDAVGPTLGYCCRLAHRMQRMGWKPSDPMYVAAWASYEALHALHIHAHYASCGMTGGQQTAPPNLSHKHLPVAEKPAWPDRAPPAQER